LDIFGIFSIFAGESDPDLNTTAKQSSVGEFVSLAAIFAAVISYPSKIFRWKKYTFAAVLHNAMETLSLFLRSCARELRVNCSSSFSVSTIPNSDAIAGLQKDFNKNDRVSRRSDSPLYEIIEPNENAGNYLIWLESASA
jgi:hypothetical protein